MKNWIVAIVASVVSGAAFAQGFPAKPVTLVSPFPPGGSTDTTARIIAERMRAPLGQAMVVESVGGAGGSIGVGRVARSAPDGYTIDIGQWDTHVGNIIFPLNYDLAKDFQAVGAISINPQLMIARKDFPASDLKGLVAWMKANPGKATLANQNAAAQMSGMLLQQLTGTSLLMVPYRGAGPAMQDVIAGHIDLIVVQAAAALPQVKGGAIKPYANLSPSRSPVVPTIPTSDEGGVPGSTCRDGSGCSRRKARRRMSLQS